MRKQTKWLEVDQNHKITVIVNAKLIELLYMIQYKRVFMECFRHFIRWIMFSSSMSISLRPVLIPLTFMHHPYVMYVSSNILHSLYSFMQHPSWIMHVASFINHVRSCIIYDAPCINNIHCFYCIIQQALC